MVYDLDPEFKESLETALERFRKTMESNSNKCWPEYEYAKRLPAGSKQPRYRKRTKIILRSREFNDCSKAFAEHVMDTASRSGLLRGLAMYRPAAYTVVCDRSNNVTDCVTGRSSCANKKCD